MQLTLKQLEAFVWVADLGSFRQAAERLNTTQPNISARIAGLEALLGTTLLTRGSGSVQVTAKGAELLDHARAVLAQTDGLIAAAGQSDLIDGTLRLGVTEMIVHTWLQPYLRQLKDMFPNLSVELTVDLSANLEKALSDRTIDLAIQNGPFSQPISGEIPLGKYPLIWVAAPGLLPAGPISNDQLAQHPILTHMRGSRLFRDVSGHLGVTDARLVPSSNLAACLHMTLNGMGVASLPGAMVTDELSAGTLVKLDHDWVPAPLEFFARFDAGTVRGAIRQAAELAVSIQKIDYKDNIK